MRQITPVNKLPVWLSWLAAAIIAILPFHAFLTVWLSSLTGHYTLWRLWKEFLLIQVMLGAVYFLIKDGRLRARYFKLWAVRLILVYVLLLVVNAIVARATGNVGTKAMLYGLLVDLRFLVFFLSVLVISCRCGWLADRWLKLLMVPAIIVAAFAILQYLVLPTDFLRHFGYGDATISPYETINKNVHNLRVASTLRGANPLGAYLLLPICTAAGSLLWQKGRRRDTAIVGAGLLLALVFSFSRAAWIGALAGILMVGWLAVSSPKLKRLLWTGLAAAIVVAAAAVIILRDNPTFQNIVFHTDRTPSAITSSDEGHKAAFKNAARDIVHEPLGRGVGTAGPASTYNYRHFGRIAENYFLQVGQEAGWPGMALFIAICVSVGVLLWSRRNDPLALVLLSSLIGISFVNLLSHAWTDDTLSYIWWGLAGIALAPIMMDKHNQKNGTKTKITPKRRSPVR